MPARRLVKHIVPSGGPLVIDAPVGSRIVAVGVQVRGAQALTADGIDHCVWMEQVTGPPRGALARWIVHVLMTGEYVRDGMEHLGTHVGEDYGGSPYVAHFYEERMR